MNNPLISIIVPIYKTEIYLKQCVDGIIAQTLKNIEIILVDDGSPDKCPEICDVYAKIDERIKVIHQKNGGYGKACNAGINASRGEYIGIVESDDYIENDMYETLYSAAIEDNSQIIKASFFREYQDGTNDIFSLKHLTNNNYKCKLQPADSIPLMLHDSSIWSAIYNKNFINKNNIKMLETDGASFQDDVWKMQTFVMAECITVIDKPVYHYRYMREGSSCVSKGNMDAVFYNYEEIKRYIIVNNKFEQYKNSYYLNYIKSAYFNYNRLDNYYQEELILKFGKIIEEAVNNKFNIDEISEAILPLMIKSFYYEILFKIKSNIPNYKKKIIIAVVQVQNESDIIESLCRYYCSFCDGIIVADDMSSDNTLEILKLLEKEGLPVYIAGKNDVDHGYESINARHKQLLLAADKYNADIILPVDSDEFIVGINGGNPRYLLESLDEKIEYHIPWRNFICTKKAEDNTEFYPLTTCKYSEPPFSKAIISRYLLKEKNAFPETGCHSFFYQEDPPVVHTLTELIYNHYPYRNPYHFMLKTILGWTLWLTCPYHDGSARFSKGFHLKTFYDEIKKYGVISNEMIEKYSTYIDFPVPNDANYILKESRFDISFCKNKLILQYTDYKVKEDDFIKTLTIQLEKNLRNMPSWRSSLERRIAGEQLGQANVIISNLNDYIKIIQKQNITSPLFCTFFFDTGNEFNENEKIHFEYSRGVKYFHNTVKIPEKTKAVRFDPVEGYGCFLQKLIILSDEKHPLDYQIINGFKTENDGIIFSDTDPQIIIKFNDKNISNMIVIFHINFFLL